MLNIIKSWIIYWRYLYYCIKAALYRNAGSKDLDKRKYGTAWAELDIAIESSQKAMWLSEQYELLRGRPI